MSNPPELKIISPRVNTVVKVTTDQELELNFTTSQPNWEYDIWTNWDSGQFHSEPVVSDSKGNLKALLPADITGFYIVGVRYRPPHSPKFVTSGLEFEVHVEPDWIRSAVVYNIFLRAFKAKDLVPGEGGTFEEIIQHMDNLVKLGVNVIYLNPFQIIGELYRKYNPADHLPGYLQPGSPYSIKDPKSIDPELAFSQKDMDKLLSDPKRQFHKLVNAAHKRGIRVIMDLVFNHVAHDFVLQRIFPEWFLYKEDPMSPDQPFLYPEDIENGLPWGDAKHTMVPFDEHAGAGWSDVAQLNWEYKRPPGPNNPPPNTKIKEMYEYFKSIPKYWVQEFGVDGFRCDVAYRVPPKFWKECIRETREFAKQQFPGNGAIDGEVIFIAESYINDLNLLFSAGFTLCYGDFSNKIYTPQTLKGYLDYMYNINTTDFPDGATWFIFPECHDFSRTTSRLVPLHESESEAAMRGNISRWILTACLPGMPMIFNGFEKVTWHQVDHVAYSKINWEGRQDISPVLAAVNKIRSSYLSLQKGNYNFVETTSGLGEDSKIFAFMRYIEDEVLLIAVNMDIHNQAGTELILQDVPHFQPQRRYILKDLLSGTIYDRNSERLPIVLDPGESHIFVVEQKWGDTIELN